MAVLGATTSCAAESEIDALTNCLDDADVTYSVEDGAVIVNQYAEKDSEQTRAAAQACLELADGK